MAVLINNLSAAMGSVNQTPAGSVSFKLQDSAAYTSSVFLFQYQVQGGSYVDCTVHAATPTLANLQSYTNSPGRTNNLYWNVKVDLPNSTVTVRVKLQVRNANSEYSNTVESEWFQVKTTNPTFELEASLPAYVNAPSISLPVMASDDAVYIKLGESSTLESASWTEVVVNSETGDKSASLTFSTGSGRKNVWGMVRDAFYNVSDIKSDYCVMHTTPPTKATVKIVGTIPGVEAYTGVVVAEDGSMAPSRAATLIIYAEDALDIEMYIDGDVEDGPLIRQWVGYKGNLIDGETGLPFVRSTVDIVLAGEDFDYCNEAVVTVKFRDAALNEVTPVPQMSIMVNTRIFKTAKRLLRSPSSEYDHQVLRVSETGATSRVDRSVAMVGSYKRAWSEVFFPASHDYPRLADGTINAPACVSMGEHSNTANDAVRLSGGSILYDSESRPITAGWTSDGSKNYGNMESSHQGNLRYWVVDNTGYGDIELEFEQFHLSPNSFGPPYNRMSSLINPLASHVGDHLVMYNADAAGCLSETIGEDGTRTYALADSSKLVEMYAYTGDGNQVVELCSGRTANADAQGGFKVPVIRGVNKILMMFFSDASVSLSGFKLKAGPKHDNVFKNFDVDEQNGEVWLHEYPDGMSSSIGLQMVYDYQDVELSFDLDKGEVVLRADPSGVVTADYTYYLRAQDRSPSDSTRMFAVSYDDFVDYLEPAFFVVPSGQQVNRAALYVHGYPSSPSPSGKLAANYIVDKDRGVMEFSDGTQAHGDEFAYVPGGRLVGDYFHHTFQRLSNDGYGTLKFRDSTMVADTTPLYPDYTWVDVKISNEGDSTLEQAKIKFLSRGYDSNQDGVMEQVLDINRPWDVQMGTAAETYDKVAMKPSQNYDFPTYLSRAESASILSQYKDSVIPFNIEPRRVFYGRCTWTLGGTSQVGYPSTSIGSKIFSCELAGKFYSIQA